MINLRKSCTKQGDKYTRQFALSTNKNAPCNSVQQKDEGNQFDDHSIINLPKVQISKHTIGRIKKSMTHVIDIKNQILREQLFLHKLVQEQPFSEIKNNVKVREYQKKQNNSLNDNLNDNKMEYSHYPIKFSIKRPQTPNKTLKKQIPNDSKRIQKYIKENNVQAFQLKKEQKLQISLKIQKSQKVESFTRQSSINSNNRILRSQTEHFKRLIKPQKQVIGQVIGPWVINKRDQSYIDLLQ